ncbi:MAG: hypothetical protein M1561_02920 [Gammaproteobacteria bacterium]|nr:hypothetical protein [Gammaproteobacteria bacterium]
MPKIFIREKVAKQIVLVEFDQKNVDAFLKRCHALAQDIVKEYQKNIKHLSCIQEEKGRDSKADSEAMRKKIIGQIHEFKYLIDFLTEVAMKMEGFGPQYKDSCRALSNRVSAFYKACLKGMQEAVNYDPESKVSSSHLHVFKALGIMFAPDPTKKHPIVRRENKSNEANLSSVKSMPQSYSQVLA